MQFSFCTVTNKRTITIKLQLIITLQHDVETFWSVIINCNCAFVGTPPYPVPSPVEKGGE